MHRSRPSLFIAVMLVGAAAVATLGSMTPISGRPGQWLPLLPHALTLGSIWIGRRNQAATEVCAFVAGAMAALSFADLVLPISRDGSDPILEPGFRRACVWFAEMPLSALLFGGVLAYRWTNRPEGKRTSADH
jgi:hypothetical protein